MTSKFPKGPAAIAGAIGSAAVAAAMLYATKQRRAKTRQPEQLGPIPGGENPETD